MASDYKVSRGKTTTSGLSMAQPITAVGDVTKAAPFIASPMNGSSGADAGGTANGFNHQLSGSILLTALDEITITRAGTTGEDFRWHWDLVEYLGAAGGANAIVVRHSANVTIASGQLTDDFTITGVSDINKCVPIVAGVYDTTTSGFWGNVRPALEMIDDAGTIKVRATRATTSGICRISLVVVEFTGSAWTVWNNQGFDRSSTAPESHTIPDVGDWTKTMIFGSYYGSGNRNNDEISMAFWPGPNTTTLRSEMNGTSAGRLVAHLVKHNDLVVQHLNSIDGGESPLSGSSNPRTVDVTVTAVPDQASTTYICSLASRDGSTIYPRIHWACYPTADTTVQFWAQRGGSTDDFALQVVSLENLAGGEALQADLQGYASGLEGIQVSLDAFTHGEESIQIDLAGYATGEEPIAQTQPAFAAGIEDLLAELQGYLDGQEAAATDRPGYLTGLEFLLADLAAYLRGEQEMTATLDAYVFGVVSEELSSDQPGFVGGLELLLQTVQAFARGQESLSADQQAFVDGVEANLITILGYVRGQESLLASVSGFLDGVVIEMADQPGFTRGQETSTASLSGFTRGSLAIQGTLSAFIEGSEAAMATVNGFLRGSESLAATLDGYIFGAMSEMATLACYVEGFSEDIEVDPRRLVRVNPEQRLIRVNPESRIIRV